MVSVQSVRHTVTSLRRYPVKSMGGEALQSVELDHRGLVGDRWYAVRDEQGHFASGKNTRRFHRRDAIFEYAAHSIDGGVTVVRGGESWTVGDPGLDVDLSLRMSAAVSIAAERDVPHQDMGAVSLIGTSTLAWCAERWDVNADPRRLRVNLVVETSEPFEEEDWAGRRASVGDAVIELVERCPRCRMIDINQDGATATGRWLRRLGAERDLFLGMYADVVRPGLIAVGDPLRIG